MSTIAHNHVHKFPIAKRLGFPLHSSTADGIISFTKTQRSGGASVFLKDVIPMM